MAHGNPVAGPAARPAPARPARTRLPPARLVALALAGAVLVASAAAALAVRKEPLIPPLVFRVEAGDRVLGYVPEEDWLDQARDALAGDLALELGRPVMLLGEVRLTPMRLPTGVVALDYQTFRARLRTVLAPAQRAVALVVDGRQVAVVEDEAAADGVLQSIRDAYLEAIGADTRTTLLSLEFEEDVRLEPVASEIDEIRDVETARRILERGTDAVEVHVVKRNESLWSIATGRGVTVEALRQANPQLKGDLLQIGQQLNLIVPVPYLNLISVEERVLLQAIPFPVITRDDPNLWPWQQRIEQRGSQGQRELVVRITRQNARETERAVLSQRVVREAVTQIQYRGTKTVPSYGTGALVWPVPDGGQLTSRFGRRGWSMHNGIDIAAPAGTAIVAADAGVVVKSEWYGGYGNVIYIDHGNGRVTVYAHNQANLVKVGDVVQKGQLIARMGSTGRSTGPHLHFEVLVNGKPVDPLQFYPGG